MLLLSQEQVSSHKLTRIKHGDGKTNQWKDEHISKRSDH